MVYYLGAPIVRLQLVAESKEPSENLYLVELPDNGVVSVPRHRITANGGQDEVVETERRTRGNVIWSSLFESRQQ